MPKPPPMPPVECAPRTLGPMPGKSAAGALLRWKADFIDQRANSAHRRGFIERDGDDAMIFRHLADMLDRLLDLETARRRRRILNTLANLAVGVMLAVFSFTYLPGLLR